MQWTCFCSDMMVLTTVTLGIMLYFSGVGALSCPSGCQYGTTIEEQTVTKGCRTFVLFKSRCTRTVKVCVCATDNQLTTLRSNERPNQIDMETGSTTESTKRSTTALPATTNMAKTSRKQTTQPSSKATVVSKTNSEADTATLIRNICETRPENAYYLPYPEDASKFVQCDLAGRAYLRACPPTTGWHRTLHACVGKQFLNK
ncbi:uncharacterized protein [Argopecten irradians]|uniref:uncharacterized protein n=1 Tax=Argopecten irradians TaxID=31199 RepID=UPI00371DCE73